MRQPLLKTTLLSAFVALSACSEKTGQPAAPETFEKTCVLNMGSRDITVDCNDEAAMEQYNRIIADNGDGYAIDGKKIPPEIYNALQEAALFSPLSMDLKARLTWLESRWKSDAKNPKSGARGLEQLIPGLAMEMLYKHGPEHGYEEEQKWVVYYSKGKRDADGNLIRKKNGDPIYYELAEGVSEKQLYDLMFDPVFSSIMGERYRLEYGAKLEKKLAEIIPDKKFLTETDLYGLHLLGYNGMIRYMKGVYNSEDPDALASTFVNPDAYKRNPGIFYEADKNGKLVRHFTAAESYLKMAEKYNFGFAPLPSLAEWEYSEDSWMDYEPGRQTFVESPQTMTDFLMAIASQKVNASAQITEEQYPVVEISDPIEQLLSQDL